MSETLTTATAPQSITVSFRVGFDSLLVDETFTLTELVCPSCGKKDSVYDAGHGEKACVRCGCRFHLQLTPAERVDDWDAIALTTLRKHLGLRVKAASEAQ